MRSTYYPGVCTKPGTYYQGWFMYMRYTQGQNEDTYYPGVCTKPGTYYQDRFMYSPYRRGQNEEYSTYHPGVHTYVLTQVLSNQAGLYSETSHTYVLAPQISSSLTLSAISFRTDGCG